MSNSQAELNSASLSDSISLAGASAAASVSSGLEVGDKITLRASGFLSSHPEDGAESRYDAGAYVGLQTTFITAPSENAYDPFWGKETEGLPVVLHWSYSDHLDINNSYNASVNADYPDYQYGEPQFESFYGPKVNGGGVNSLLSDRQLPEEYLTPDESESQYSSVFSPVNRSTASYHSTFPGGAHEELQGSRDSLIQLGDTATLIAEADFKASVLDGTLPSHVEFDTALSYELNVDYLDPADVGLKLMPGVSGIAQQPKDNFSSRDVSLATMAKYWENKYINEGVLSNPLPSDEEILERFRILEADPGYVETNDPGDKILNQYFNQYINPFLGNSEENNNEKLTTRRLGPDEITFAQVIDSFDKGQPIYISGESSGGQTRVSVAYGMLSISSENSNANGKTFLALQGDLTQEDKARNIYTDRMWVQEGGAIQDTGYDKVTWVSPSDVANKEPLIFPTENEQWTWDNFVLVEPKVKKYYAILVGMDEFSNQVDDIEKGLSKFDGWSEASSEDNILLFLNPSASDVGAAINDIKDKIEPGDEFLFYYQGHTKDVATSSVGKEPEVIIKWGPDNEFERHSSFNEAMLFGPEGDRVVFFDDALENFFSQSQWSGVQKSFIFNTCYAGGYWGSQYAGLSPEEIAALDSVNPSLGLADSDLGDLSNVPNVRLFASSYENELTYPWYFQNYITNYLGSHTGILDYNDFFNYLQREGAKNDFYSEVHPIGDDEFDYNVPYSFFSSSTYFSNIPQDQNWANPLGPVSTVPEPASVLFLGLGLGGLLLKRRQRHGITKITRKVLRCLLALFIWPCLVSFSYAGELEDNLLKAAESGNAVEVSSLLAQGATVNAKTKDRVTPLMIACYGGYVDVVKLLLDKGADVNAKAWWGYTALIAASTGALIDLMQPSCCFTFKAQLEWERQLRSSAGRAELVKMLLDRGADVNAKDSEGATALMMVGYGWIDVAKVLLDKGADVNARDNEGTTVLMKHACDADIVKLLLDKGANVNAKNKYGVTASLEACSNAYAARDTEGFVTGMIELGCHKGCADAVRVLLEHGADVVNNGAVLMAHAVRGGEVDTVKLLLEKGFDVDSNVLKQACFSSCLDVFRMVLEKNPEVNVKDDVSGDTLLMNAVSRMWVEGVKFLLEKGADVNIRNKYGWTALMKAADIIVPVEISKMLLDKGAEVDAKNMHGSTALMDAVTNGHADVVKLLLDKGADVNIKNNHGETALSLARKEEAHWSLVKSKDSWVLDKRQTYQKIVELLEAAVAKRKAVK